ncbi:hypothetical protein EUX98_g5564 [Antrodiella citrinella]|uniref:Galactose oxidase-like Early set domain-containing protein n=1 Tax=Antrodiella citrinella TaxID=2447956 RepID=A0A4S4MR53_9APHY|nr:hypothetical protein EUX98_g5564 [Antrodiella citrinella]
MFAVRTVGCAFYALALIVSTCHAASVPPAGSSVVARNADKPKETISPTLDVHLYPNHKPRDIAEILEVRDVYAPRITEPKTTTVWTSGYMAVVRWDTSDPPKSITNRNGKLVLGYMDETGDEHLFLAQDKPLATNFNIMAGYAEVEVPQVPPGKNYIVILFGDSGNRSPEFTIRE